MNLHLVISFLLLSLIASSQSCPRSGQIAYHPPSGGLDLSEGGNYPLILGDEISEYKFSDGNKITKDVISENHIEKIYDELVEEYGQPLINKLIRDFYEESNNKKDNQAIVSM